MTDNSDKKNISNKNRKNTKKSSSKANVEAGIKQDINTAKLNKIDSPVPPDAPLEMLEQNLKEAPKVNIPKEKLYFRTILARLITFLGAFIIGSFGTWQLHHAMGSGKHTILQWILLILFSITFYWVSFSATSAISGLIPSIKRKKISIEEAAQKSEKVAIVMPVYGEDVSVTNANLLTIAESLAEQKIASRCEIFILSDTQNADLWIQETNAFAKLKEQSPLPVFYRRRTQNLARKAGNIAQFIRRWGARYEYFLVLDADSLMTGETIAQMICRMDAQPNLGLLQTAPQLCGGESFLARTIQFASALYGQVVARGIDAWQGNEGNYWGHNAIIRTKAFAQSCGLPELKGRRPIGGHILSHDFVEAALLRRNGWLVRMDADLDGSYEGLPPTLDDLAGRERRWAQGNLQHLGVILTKGVKTPNRMHFIIGIAGYLMSPIWLLMLSVGIAITAQALFTQPQYFPLAHQLFPNWPTFDPQKMMMLFFDALFLLLIPKFIGLFIALISNKKRRAFGGIISIFKGFICELLISTLYAPMMMLIQTHHIISIIIGKDSGWNTQARSGDVLAWKLALKRTYAYVIAGIIPLVVLIIFAPNQIIWLSPIIIGLLFSPFLTRHSGNNKLGAWLAKHNCLLIPSEVEIPKIISKTFYKSELFKTINKLNLTNLLDPENISNHRKALDLAEKIEETRERRIFYITTEAKINAAKNIKDLYEILDKKESLIAVSNHKFLDLISKLKKE